VRRATGPYPRRVVTGSVLSLHRWPVKSLGGEPVGALRVDPRGAAGDRAHALYDEFRGAPRRLTAREAPRMLAWGAGYEDAEPDLDAVPLPLLRAPDGASYRWDDERLPAALAADLGRDVALRRDLALMQDLGDSLLVTVQATLEATERALGLGLDLRRFRPNLHVALDAPAFAEEGWEGRTLMVGDVALEVLHPCERCVIPTRDPDTQVKDGEILRWLTRERDCLFGLNVRASGRGRVAVGDPVRLA
jgi:MOSC domain-containing protein